MSLLFPFYTGTRVHEEKTIWWFSLPEGHLRLKLIGRGILIQIEDGQCNLLQWYSQLVNEREPVNMLIHKAQE